MKVVKKYTYKIFKYIQKNMLALFKPSWNFNEVHTVHIKRLR